MREKHHEDRKLKVVREGHEISDKAVGEAVCKNKYSSYCASDLDPEKDLMMASTTASSLAEHGAGELGGREHETLRGSVRDLDSELEHATVNDWYYL